MDLALAIDFGSTFTKGALLDLGSGQVLGVAYEPSTVATDVVIGLQAVLARLGTLAEAPIGTIPARACSSAAGGLRVAVIGLVPSLSLEAAQRAALGAGAKIIGAYGHKLSQAALSQLEKSKPDLILLAGGIDGGDEETILHNARALAKLPLRCPIIVAGNQFVSGDCRDLLADAGWNVTQAANILPDIDRVEVEEVHHLIRELFVKHITQAKGIERVADHVNLVAPIVPTPAAVLRACQLLAEGCRGQPGLGDVVIVDIGGATTDVHSASDGAPSRPGVIRRGLPDLFLKRTVEGDLGVRINAATIVERAGADAIADLAGELHSERPTSADVRSYAARVTADPEHVPENESEAALDGAMARCAIGIAMRRHAGFVKEVYAGAGMATVQYGKDLSAVSTVIGVGGVIAFGRHSAFALRGALADAGAPQSLVPERPNFLVDKSYLLYALGLLADDRPEAALRLAKTVLIAEDGAAQAHSAVSRHETARARW
ncbi:methylaspartate mutase accessory protein GlmL [Xanthobacter sediminis]